jgi:manganese/zinc/iron transport system permease protein
MMTLLAQTDWWQPFTSPVAGRIILIGALTNVACALVGCFLVLRRMSLMGDAISHAVLPGLVLAFVFSGSMNIVPLFIGAAVTGLLVTFLTQSLHQYGRVPTDASMGVVFTSLFALGVVLLKYFVSGIHFDVSCVWEGMLSKAALDTFAFAGWQLPQQLKTILPVVLLNLGVIMLLWKELKVSAFDPALATSMGFSATSMHYLLMAVVAVTTVASFEAVGSILVIAMLIVPPATAQLLSDRLSRMVLLACVFAVLAAVLGYWGAVQWNVEPAGTMAVVAGGMYALAVLFAPRYGILSALVRNLQTTLRILREDLLLMLYRVEEIDVTKRSSKTVGDCPNFAQAAEAKWDCPPLGDGFETASRRLQPAEAIAAVGGGWLARWALAMLRRRGRVEIQNGKLHMTEDGRWRAARLVRGHRLWEAYLVKHLGLPLDHVHAPADRVEHFIQEPLREQLQQAVDDAARDPHGREIPG